MRSLNKIFRIAGAFSSESGAVLVMAFAGIFCHVLLAGDHFSSLPPCTFVTVKPWN